MDIQKEREAFEKHASKFFITNEAFEDDGENYVYDEVKFMWDCWLEAKAQAIPDGFVVVPKEPTPKMIDATWNFDEEIQDMSHNSRNEFIYNAMIAAAEAESEV